MSDALFVTPALPPRFNPDKDCASCKYPLPVDQVVQTVCTHIFHEQCLIQYLNGVAAHNRPTYDKAQAAYPELQRKYQEELRKGEKPEKPEVPVLCPCPGCRRELNGTRLTPLTSLPPGVVKEARDCSICLTLQDPSVVKTPCHLIHSFCFDEATEQAGTAKKFPTCPEDGSELLKQDLYDGARVRQNLKLDALPSQRYVYFAGMDVPEHGANRVDSFGPNVFPPMHDDDISNIVLAIIGVVLLASIVSYVVNAIFFAGANPVLYVLGLPVGLILDPIIHGFIAV